MSYLNSQIDFVIKFMNFADTCAYLVYASLKIEIMNQSNTSHYDIDVFHILII